MEIILSEDNMAIPFKHVIVCDMKMMDGRQAKMFTAFNNCDADRIEVSAGLNFAMSNCPKVKSAKLTLYYYSEGKFRPSELRFEECEYNHKLR